MLADLSNGLFEFTASLMVLNNCRVLFKDKQRQGISKFSCLFFLSWGFWNTFYYPHLNQWWSFAGGLFVVSANILWIVMMYYYDHKNKEDKLNIQVVKMAL